MSENMSEKWYRRSYADGDAHSGSLNEIGAVTARCGVTFTPQSRLFGEGPAFLRPSVDRLQACCPACLTAAQRTTEDPDGVAVRSLIDALGSPKRRLTRNGLRNRFGFDQTKGE